MYEVTLPLHKKTMSALNLTTEQMRDEMRLAAGVKLYELGRISSGVAANIAATPRVVFLSKLADYGVDTFGM